MRLHLVATANVYSRTWKRTRQPTEITDLVEQEGHHIIGSKRRLSNSEQGKEHASQAASVHSAVTTSASDHDSHQQRANQEDDKLVIAIEDPFPSDESEIPEWVIAESKALSREITPPEQLIFRHWSVILHLLLNRA